MRALQPGQAARLVHRRAEGLLRTAPHLDRSVVLDTLWGALAAADRRHPLTRQSASTLVTYAIVGLLHSSPASG